MAKIIKTKQKRSKKYRRQRFFAILAILLALIATGGAVVAGRFVAQNQGPKIDDGEVDMTWDKDRQDRYDIISRRSVMESYSYEQTSEAYRKLADEAKSEEDKQSALLRQASYAINNERYDEAWEIALSADEMGSGVPTQSMLALIAEGRGDNSAALKYYSMVLEAYEKSPPANVNDIDRLKSKVEDLAR